MYVFHVSLGLQYNRVDYFMRLIVISIFSLFIFSCSTTYPNNDITGANFPSVTGESLEKNKVNIPQDFQGKPSLLLIGYKQNSQFDIDRWLIGLDMTQTKVDVYEIPTIQGWVPRLFSSMIDNGMRAGIPQPLWKIVITVYEDGDKIQAFTGNTNPNNTRVVLLDENGKIIFFHDQGFSVQALNNLRTILIK